MNKKMSDEEQNIYRWLSKEAKPDMGKFRWRIVIASIVVLLAILGLAAWYWQRPDVGPVTALALTSHLSMLYGTLLLALVALSHPETLALMSMTRFDGNPRLYAELMKARLAARFGLYFIVGAFSIQAAVTLAIGR